MHSILTVMGFEPILENLVLIRETFRHASAKTCAQVFGDFALVSVNDGRMLDLRVFQFHHTYLQNGLKSSILSVQNPYTNGEFKLSSKYNYIYMSDSYNLPFAELLE